MGIQWVLYTSLHQYLKTCRFSQALYGSEAGRSSKEQRFFDFFGFANRNQTPAEFTDGPQEPELTSEISSEMVEESNHGKQLQNESMMSMYPTVLAR